MRVLVLFVSAAALCVAAWAQDCPVFLADGNNMVFMDAEQRGAGGGWEYVTPWDARGSGALEYKPWSNWGGTEWKPQNFWDPRIKTYTFQPHESGVYRIMLRSKAPHWTEHNDLWMYVFLIFFSISHC